jgi:hypothetical protein
MDTTLQVGKKLVELCRQGKHLEAIDSLYDKNIASIEAISDGKMPQRLDGFDAVRGKSVWWLENHTVHGGEVKGPFPHGDRFIVYFLYDVTPKIGPMANKRMKMEEGALYTVKNGKVVQEEFFYDMGG